MDAAQPDILQGTQIGIEGTKGTGVQANLILPTVTLKPKPVDPSEMKSARGSKIDSEQTLLKGAMCTAALTGYASFFDLAILFYQLFGIATSTAVTAGVVDLTWLLKARKKDDIRTATYEVGGEDYAARFVYGSLVSFGQNISKANNDIDGNVVGRQLAEQGVILTANPTIVPNVPLSPNRNDFYVSDTLATVADAASNLEEFNTGKLTFGERRAPWFSGSGADIEQSYKTLVEKKNPASVHIEMLQGSKSDTMMRALRKRASRYGRIYNKGPEIITGYNFEYDARFPFKIMNPDRGPLDDVYGGMYDLNLIDDTTLGGFFKLRMRLPSGIATYLTAGSALPAGQAPGDLIAAANAQSVGQSQGTAGQYT